MSHITLTSTSRTVTIQQTGVPGRGVPAGGTTGQVLAKVSATDYNTHWVTGGGGGGGSSTFVGLNDTPGAFVADRIVTVNAAGDALEFPTASAARTLLGLGTAAVAATGDFATAAQGTLAGTAVQPGDLATVATTGAYSDLSGLPTLFDGAYASLSGIPSTFTPSSHTHTASEVTDFSTASDARIAAASVGDLSDVDLTGLTSSKVLEYNGSVWVAIDTPSGGGGASSLGGLSDVTITSPASAQVLRYNGSGWVNAALAYGDISGTPSLATVATSGDYDDLINLPSLFDGAYSSLSGIPSTFTPAAHTLGSHSNVAAGADTAATGNFLKWTGLDWDDAALAAGDIKSGTFTTAQIPDLAASKITSGTLDNARISQASVTQHEAALAILGSQVTGKQGPGAAFDGGGAVLTSGVVVRSPVTEAGTVTACYADADASGSVDVIVRRYAAADTTFATPASLGTLSISTAAKGSLTGLSQAVAVGDTLEFELSGTIATIERLAVRSRI